MVIIIQNTLEYMIKESKYSTTNNITDIWPFVKPEHMRETVDGIKYVKLEL